MRIGENLSNSFGFAQDALVGKWVRWIMLVISSLIFPVLYGYTVIVMRGEEPVYEEESFFSLFINGIKLFVINILYMIVPAIVFIVTIGYTVVGIISSGGDFSFPSLLGHLAGLLGGILLTCILAIIFALLGVIGAVRFARSGSMAEAFAFGEIIGTIGKIGWLKYILSLLVLFIVVFIIIMVISAIEMVIGMIPVIGWILSFVLNIVLSLFIGPFISLMTSRFYSLLYDQGI